MVVSGSDVIYSYDSSIIRRIGGGRRVAALTEEPNAMTVVQDGMEYGYFAGLEQGQLDNEAANAMGDEEEWSRWSLISGKQRQLIMHTQASTHTHTHKVESRVHQVRLGGTSGANLQAFLV